jgi:hypothetical protein
MQRFSLRHIQRFKRVVHFVTTVIEASASASGKADTRNRRPSAVTSYG